MGTLPVTRGLRLSIEFQFPRLERVISGAGIVDSLAAEIDRRRLSRIVVVTGRTLGASALLERITEPLGDRCVPVFKDAKQHVPSCSVAELALAIDQRHADCVISFGGGSPIDTVKAAIHTLLTTGGGGLRPDEGPAHIAIPTTLSAGEFTAVAGITDEQTRVKRAVVDPRLAPRTVITDPTLTLETPAWLWAAVGVRALDHAVESIYSCASPSGERCGSRARVVDAGEASARQSLDDRGRALEHRLQCQLAAWMCVFGVTNAGLGLSHALGHQIGPRWNVPHGVTSCITLPHAMRFMARARPSGSGRSRRPLACRSILPNRKTRALESADRMTRFIGAVRRSAAASRCGRAARRDARSRRSRPRHPGRRAGERSSGQFRAADIDADRTPTRHVRALSIRAVGELEFCVLCEHFFA